VTVPNGPLVEAVSFTHFLPDTLPDGEAVKTAAGKFETHRDTMDTAYTDTLEKWGEISDPEVFVIPEPNLQTTITAFRDNIEPLGTAVCDGLLALKDAMDAYGESLIGFESTHSSLKERVNSFNALPDNQYSGQQISEATEAGTILPATRTPSGRSTLVADLQTAKETYRGYVDTCVSAIEDATPTVVRDGPRNIADNIALLKKSYNLATTWVDRGASFVGAGHGRMRFIWKADARTLSDFIHEGVPGWKSVHDSTSLTHKFLPNWFKNRIPDSSQFADMTAVKALDTWYESRIGKMTTATDKYTAGLMAALPTVVMDQLDKIKNSKAGRFIAVNRVKKHNGKWRVEFNVGNKQSQIPERIRAQMGKFDDAKKFLDKIGENKFVKYGGKALGALDIGATYYESYGNNYNEALRENPNASVGALRHDAAVSTAIEGTAENTGKVVGGVIGRSAGAAIGQALIPIPGVGAAVGGFVGGVVGDYVGGKVGAGVGEFINDWRQGGADKAFGDAGKAIGNAGESVVEGVKDIGKNIGKKLLGW
jgi:hypothetical protein